MQGFSWRSLLFAALAAGAVAPITHAQSADGPVCGVFFARWDDPSAPRQIVQARGTAHEFAAAEDCLRQEDRLAACAHWDEVRTRLDGMPELAALMGDGLRQKMQENGCR